MSSSTIELSYLQSENDSLYQKAQKEGVHCFTYFNNVYFIYKTTYLFHLFGS